MIRRRVPRRITGAILLVAGGLAMWLAPESRAGGALLLAGIALEAIGLRMERRANDGEGGRDAAER